MKSLAKIVAFCVACAVPIGLAASAALQGESASPQQVVDELLAADRAFAAAGGDSDTVTALAAMFHDDVIMPLPTGIFARGRAAAVEALRTNPFNSASRAEWSPVRGGVSADGQQGFTFGYMILRGNDGEVRLAKYLAYWLRTPDGWRVAAYKRAQRPEGPLTSPMPPALPARLVAITTDPSVLESHRAGLRAAEQAFSDEAQRIGVGPAFQRNGSSDAMNMGREAAFVIGADAIGEAIGGGETPAVPAPIHWNADDLLVATSGDLGVTWGFIRPNGPEREGRPAAVPFFTVWRRDLPGARWLYVAE